MPATARYGKTYWFDIPARDLLDAMSFYEGLFGWSFLKLSDPVISNYYVIQQGTEMIGGIRQVSQINSGAGEMTSPVLYFTVDDLSKSVNRAKDLGAQLVGERVDMGKERGAYQWLRDREGNLIALWAAQ